MKPLPLILYRGATAALEPLAPALLALRGRQGKEERRRIGERLGRASLPRPDGPLVWLHGASVGESLSLLPLIEALREARPELGLLVTSGTVTSAELLGRRLPEGVLHQYAPVDAPGPADRFLQRWRPELAAFVESELWPNLVLGAKAQGARLALVSARLSEQSLRGWSRVPATARTLLGAFDLVLAQDDPTAARLLRLGARDDGRLNLKLAGEPLPADADALSELTRAAEGRPVLVAASTHPGEEEPVLAAFAALKPRALPPLLVIVPRHPVRGPDIADKASAGLRSRGDPFGAGPIYVADTLGELGVWLRLCRAAFVGGSLVSGVGGHNPLEPARLDRPAASGPHVSNWRSVYEALDAAGGIAWVRSADALADFWDQALGPGLCAQAERARLFAQSQTGAVDGAVARLLKLLP